MLFVAFILERIKEFSNSQILDNFRNLMDKDQLISMIHFLEKRDEERKKENED